jgi:hypothetical protein
LAAATIASASFSERRVKTLGLSKPGIGGRCGSAPRARIRGSRAQVQLGDLGFQPQIDVVILVPAVLSQRHPFRRRLAGQKVL